MKFIDTFQSWSRLGRNNGHFTRRPVYVMLRLFWLLACIIYSNCGYVDSVSPIRPLDSQYLYLSDVEDKALYCGAFQQVVLVHLVLLIAVCAIRMGK